MADTLTIPLRPTQDKDLYRLLNWFACWLEIGRASCRERV